MKSSEIGKAIKYFRVKKGYNQKEFAKLCNITQTSLSQIETGKCNPHHSTEQRISEVLRVPSSVLNLMSLTGNDVPEENKEKFKILYPSIQAMLEHLFTT